MKRLIVLLAAMCAIVASNIVRSQETRYVEPTTDDVNYTYEVCEGNIHYVYNLVFTRSIYSGEIFQFRGFSLNGMWHEPDAEIPEVVTIPEKVHIKYPVRDLDFTANVKIDRNFMANLAKFPDEMISFNTLRIPKNIDIIESEYSMYFIDVLVKAFDVEEGNDHGSFSENGVWFRKYNYIEPDQCEIFYFPLLAEWVNYQFPDWITTLQTKYYYYQHYPWETGIVPFFNDNLEDIYDGVFDSWPFYGNEIPPRLRSQGFSTFHSQKKCYLKAFDCCDFPLGNDIVAARFPKTFNASIPFNYFYDVYNVKEQKKNLLYVEFSSPRIPTIHRPNFNEDLPEIAAKNLLDAPKVVTYVQPQLVDGFKELQRQNMFPVNADIRPIENKLYVYPELDNGRWVKGRTQMVYAVCRFGDADISEIKWETDNDEISHIDEGGVLTVEKEGPVEVTCTITDTEGQVYESKRKFNVTDKELTTVKEIEEVPVSMGSQPGVYNLHGMKVADTPENIPAGIYIHNGKKIAVTR